MALLALRPARSLDVKLVNKWSTWTMDVWQTRVKEMWKDWTWLKTKKHRSLSTTFGAGRLAKLLFHNSEGSLRGCYFPLLKQYFQHQESHSWALSSLTGSWYSNFNGSTWIHHPWRLHHLTFPRHPYRSRTLGRKPPHKWGKHGANESPINLIFLSQRSTIYRCICIKQYTVDR